MILQAGLIDAFSQIPLHLDFINDDNVLINVLFAGVLGMAIGTVLAAIIKEIYNILND